MEEVSEEDVLNGGNGDFQHPVLQEDNNNVRKQTTVNQPNAGGGINISKLRELGLGLFKQTSTLALTGFTALQNYVPTANFQITSEVLNAGREISTSETFTYQGPPTDPRVTDLVWGWPIEAKVDQKKVNTFPSPPTLNKSSLSNPL